jgi:hypothetical protein
LFWESERFSPCADSRFSITAKPNGIQNSSSF